MSDERDPEIESGLDPEADARIRALLADAGSRGEAIPPEVASRLEDTLRDLVAERDGDRAGVPAGDGSVGDNVVPLRRRWGQRATVAAAAVVVLAVGGAAVGAMGGFGGLGSSLDSKVSSESAGSAADDSNGLAEAPPSVGAPLPSPGAVDRRQADATKSGLPAVRSASFAEDVTVLLSSRTTLTPEGSAEGQAEESPQPSTDAFAGDCPGPRVQDGSDTNVVTYDGALAALVVHPVADGARLVEAWTCDGGTRLATASVAP